MTKEEQDEKEFEEWFNEKASMDATYWSFHRWMQEAWFASRRSLREKEGKDENI